MPDLPFKGQYIYMYSVEGNIKSWFVREEKYELFSLKYFFFTPQKSVHFFALSKFFILYFVEKLIRLIDFNKMNNTYLYIFLNYYFQRAKAILLKKS